MSQPIPSNVYEDMSKEQVKSVSSWLNEKHRDVLNSYMTIGYAVCIVYQTPAGYIGARLVDRSGVWVKTRYYASFNPISMRLAGLICEQKSIAYGTE
jgi:hypothetical protein